MSEPVVTLCSSAQLDKTGPSAGVVAVCDSPLSTSQITTSSDFLNWPASSQLAILQLDQESDHLPFPIRRLVESPFRQHVVLCRASCFQEGHLLTADALWRQIVENSNVWVGSIPGVSPSRRDDWPTLAPGRPAPTWQVRAIQSLTGKSPRQTTLFRAGLYLLHDCLDESHVQSQSMEGDRDADLWHAIMHRREPDYGNAKYWCRRVRSHPVHDQLAPLAAPILASAGVTGFTATNWDSFQFVDLCERVANENSPANRAAREVQWLEMNLHLAHCAQGR